MSGPSTYDAAWTLSWFGRFAATVASEVATLTDLDRLAGDGDFGENLHAAVDSAATAIAADTATVSGVFGHLATAFLQAGGTSGPLLGAWFRELARSTRDQDNLSLADLAAGVAKGTDRVQTLGGAQVGDCTMVDAMIPAAHALSAATTLDDGLRAAAEAAAAGARSTAALIATKGRASYLGRRAQDVQDPGAVAIAMLFRAALDG